MEPDSRSNATFTHTCSEVPYFSPGRSRTEAEISAASGHSFSTSSRGPHRDLLKPRKDFLTEHEEEKEEEEAVAQMKTHEAWNLCICFLVLLPHL